MKYIIIIVLIFSLPVMALESDIDKEKNDPSIVLQQEKQQNIKKEDQSELPLLQKIQRNTPKGCDPEQELKLPIFN